MEQITAAPVFAAQEHLQWIEKRATGGGPLSLYGVLRNRKSLISLAF
jgi:hypothetical protein